MGFSLKKLGSKIFDQANPFDNGRTYQQRRPTNNRSVLGQATHNGLTNVVGRQPQNFVNNVSVPVERRITNSPIGRGAETIALGGLRSFTGTAQGLSGLYDLATPGVGTNRFSKNLDKYAKNIDATVKAEKLNSGLYKGSQLGTDLLTFMTPGAFAKGTSMAGKVGVANKATSGFVKAKTAGLASKGFGGRVASKSLQNAVKPGYQGANAGYTGLQLGKEASTGKDISPERVATDLTIGGVAFPVVGAVGKEGLSAVAGKIPAALKPQQAPKVLLKKREKAVDGYNRALDNGKKVAADAYTKEIQGIDKQITKAKRPPILQRSPLTQQGSLGSSDQPTIKNVFGEEVPNPAYKPKVALKQEQAPEAPIPAQSQVDSLPNNTRVPLEVTNKNTAIGEFQQGFVDKDAPIINYLKGIEKQTGQKGLVDQFVYDTGLQRRSNAIANAQIQSSKNINKAFKGLVGDEKKSFDSYVAARQELSNAERGLPTSAPVEELQKVVTNLSRHESRFKALNKSYKEWSDKLFKSGIIDEATHKSFNANNDYTHVQRVMDDLARYSGKTGNSMSLGTTISKLKRKGSTRDIQPADATAFKYGQDVQNEIQRNQTASNLIDVLEAQGHAKRVDDTVSKNTLSRFVNGEKQVYEVPRDIKELADNISPYQLGILGRIVSAPQRLLRAGATGLSLPFTAANYVKDQVSSGVFSKDVMATHQPANIMTGLFQSAKDFGVGTDDALWQKFITHLGDTTQYDFIRNVKNSKQLSRELRLGQAGRTANRGLHPIRTLEDLNQVTEKATRFQNFKGTYEKALKEGLSESEATQKATLAAWQNSVDFSRMGHVGQAINLLIPYFNAGIQGTRLLGRRTMDAPAATASKTLGFVGLPLAGVTLYNLENEERKKVYDNISDFEKQNNIIVVLPGAKQHEDGSYTGVIKVPLQPGMSNLVQPIRMGIESFAHGNPQDVAAMSKQFFGAMAGPINTSSVSAFGGSVTPQVVKPFVQQVANKDLFTGKQIVPDYIENATDANGNPVKETDKAYKYTSGTARAIGNATGQSPIRVEKFIKDASAKVGMYSINTVDNALAKAGVIPEEQIGGVSAKEDLYRRFAVAQGKENFKKSAGAKYYDNLKKVTAGLTGNELAAFNSLHPTKKNFKGDTIYTSDKVYDPAARLDIYNRYPKVFEVDKKLDAKNKNRNPLFSLESWQVKKVLEKDNLPPGAKDPELSNLYNQPWYSDYATKRSAYFTAAKAEAEKAGKPFGKSDNPYPETPPNLQKIMDTYSSLPKGSGARSAWIKANPGAWAAMTQQFAKIDNWQNIQRGKRGLDLTEGDTGIAGGYGDSKSYSGGSGGGSGGSAGSSDPYKYAVSLGSNKTPKPKVYQAKQRKIAKAKISKPKVSIKKSKV